MNDNRYYYDEGLKRAYPSVTTITKIINKPFLTEWFKKNKKEDIDKQSAEACDIGTRIHDLVEAYIRAQIEGRAFDCPELQNGEIEYLQSFQEWEKEKGKDLRYIACERVVWNHDLCYAGRFDFKYSLKGKVWMGDLKTSKAIYPDYGLQVAAYAAADGEAQNIEVVRIDKVSKVYESRIFEYKENLELFKHANALWKWQNDWSEAKSLKIYNKWEAEQ